MGMRQDDFWSQSLQEWDARVAGFIQMQGGGKSTGEGDTMTRAELEALEQKYPDTPVN